ncbi:hypothetical protein LTR66_008627 [Elasticomyces elasticus]|nr:hypothetical protein LTR66_008627 [Elasticomyces elasticus]
MSNYNARRAPNVSQYIANLNTIPSAQELAAQQDFSNIEDDLNLFSNTQFFDFDMNDENLPDLDFSQLPPEPTQQVGAKQVDNKGVDFANVAPAPPRTVQPTPPNVLPHQLGQQAPFPGTQTLNFAASPATGPKRSSASATATSTSPADAEDTSRVAAEEDKRRRNTAASARFRVKKKQREAALEKSAREMTEKMQRLEARVGQLEMENKWLKGLIIEKGATGVEEAWKQYSDGAKGAKGVDAPKQGQRSTEERVDGVGTVGEGAKEGDAGRDDVEVDA